MQAAISRAAARLVVGPSPASANIDRQDQADAGRRQRTVIRRRRRVDIGVGRRRPVIIKLRIAAPLAVMPMALAVITLAVAVLAVAVIAVIAPAVVAVPWPVSACAVAAASAAKASAASAWRKAVAGRLTCVRGVFILGCLFLSIARAQCLPWPSWRCLRPWRKAASASFFCASDMLSYSASNTGVKVLIPCAWAATISP